MEEEIKNIAKILHEAGVGQCDCWACNEHREEIVKNIYTNHVKPLEDALKEAKAERDDWAFKCGQYDARLHRAQTDNPALAEVQEKAETEKIFLANRLASIHRHYDLAKSEEGRSTEYWLERAALARVKEPTNAD